MNIFTTLLACDHTNDTNLYPSLSQINLHSYLFPCVYIRVMCFCKCSLQLLELSRCKCSSYSSLFSFLSWWTVWLYASHLARLVQFIVGSKSYKKNYFIIYCQQAFWLWYFLKIEHWYRWMLYIFMFCKAVINCSIQKIKLHRVRQSSLGCVNIERFWVANCSLLEL